MTERFVGRSEEHMAAEIASHVDGVLPAGWYDSLREKTHDLFRAELQPVAGAVDAVRAVQQEPPPVSRRQAAPTGSGRCSG